MNQVYMNENFLLQSKTAQQLYHEYAAKMPIYDYHCHLSAAQIAEDKKFDNLTQIWLYGDHYKWRAMRANGIEERYCTGDAGDWEKFEKWAKTVPACFRNPLYHWTHLELKKPFGITDKLLGPDTARGIYDASRAMLQTDEFSVRNIMRKWNVKLICTTEDPLDSLEHHQAIRKDGFEIAVHTAWRPEKAMAAEDITNLNRWIDKLAKITDIDICSFEYYCQALLKRHDYFHQNGCRLSDHSLQSVPADYSASKSQIEAVFAKIRKKQSLSPEEIVQFKSVMMLEFAAMDHKEGWVQQLHIGPMRNTNTRMFNMVGPDTGYDSIGDGLSAACLAKFLDMMDKTDRLPKTVLYNLNPRDNEMFAAMAGNFQDGSIPGKIQYGAAWWFCDHADGIVKQLNALSNMGLLSRFIGMLTDSRCFLSYSRHEYFRRILCNLIGQEVQMGLWPKDIKLLAQMLEDICFNNAKNYFLLKIN